MIGVRLAAGEDAECPGHAKLNDDASAVVDTERELLAMTSRLGKAPPAEQRQGDALARDDVTAEDAHPSDSTPDDGRQ